MKENMTFWGLLRARIEDRYHSQVCRLNTKRQTGAKLSLA